MIQLLQPAIALLASAFLSAPQYDAHCWARVDSSQKISQTAGSFGGSIPDESAFGNDVAPIGDLNGDGVVDLAIGSPRDDDGGEDRGAVWILFIRTDGTVLDQTKISNTQGGFSGYLDDFYNFGFAVAGLGDLDGDCLPDIAVKCFCRVWILFLNADGTVKRHESIYYPSGTFGYRVTCLGDIDGDGVQDLALGDPGDDDGGPDSGAVWILFLRTDGSVRRFAKISSTSGGFPGVLSHESQLGFHVANVGDLDGDGRDELAVGGLSYAGFLYKGDVWILFLDAGGRVARGHKLEAATGFEGHIDNGDVFAKAEGVGDLDGDGVPDLAVGAGGDDDGGTDRGAVWLLAMNPNGTVKSHQKISSLIGNFSGDLADQDHFGVSIARLGDLDGDGFQDMVVGSLGDDDGGLNRGALWVLFLGQERARRSGAPTGSSTVTLPLSKQSRCLYAQARLVLDGGRHVAPGSIPILWLSPTRPLLQRRPGPAQVIRLVGAPVQDGRASFPLETRAALSIDALECMGAFLTPQLHLLPADTRIVDPAPGLPR